MKHVSSMVHCCLCKVVEIQKNETQREKYGLFEILAMKNQHEHLLKTHQGFVHTTSRSSFQNQSAYMIRIPFTTNKKRFRNNGQSLKNDRFWIRG